MSLRPIRKARHRQQARYRSFNRQQQWKPWQGWTWKRNKGFNKFFTTRRFKISILLFLAVIGIFSIDQALKGTIGNSPLPIVDPYTIIWNEPFGSNDLSGWNCNRATFTTLGATTKGINLLSDADGPALCLSKSSLDLSTAAGRELLFQFGSYTLGAQNIAYGWFLTTNKTLTAIGPDANYDPSTDPNVAVFSRRINQGGLNFLFNVLIQRDSSTSLAGSQYPNCQGGKGAGVCFILATLNSGVSGIQNDALDLNFTGTAAAASNNGRSYQQFGATVDLSVLPWLQFQAVPYYIGFFVQKGGYSEVFSYIPVVCAGGCPSGTPANAMYIEVGHETGTAPTVAPQLDTGGFFGPIIKALINLGVFILNGILQFIAFLTPALQSALGVLEGFMASVLNFIGGLLGYPTLGTDLIGFVNALVTFFTNGAYGLPAAFANFPTLFSDFLKWLQVVFPIITPAFTIANGVLTFAVNGISIAVTILTVGTQLILFGYAFILIFSYFMFTGDDAVGGLFTYLGTAQAIAFKIINLLAVFVNYGLDFLTNVIGLIPKPLVQMGAAKFPRLPTIDSGASITMPAMDLGEFRNGNLLSVWLWTLGFYFDTWYESRNPALPGSIGALIPSLATNMQTLASLLPLFQTFVLIAGGTTLFWLVMRPLHILGADLGIFESVGIGAGRRGGAGPSRFGFVAGAKHLRGGLRRTAGLEESTGGGFGSRLGKRFRGSKTSTGPTPEEQSTA